MSKWVKQNCYVVYAYYRSELYENNETPMREEEVYRSYAKAESAKAQYEADTDFESVFIEEEEREFLFEDYDKEYLRTLNKEELLAMLDDEVRKLVGVASDEWTSRKSEEYIVVKSVLAERLRF